MVTSELMVIPEGALTSAVRRLNGVDVEPRARAVESQRDNEDITPTRMWKRYGRSRGKWTAESRIIVKTSSRRAAFYGGVRKLNVIAARANR
jgi:hypothetical protein